jgi:nucleoside-diphosphate-sugar epimerase
VRVLVTGASGLLGGAVATEIARAGHTVRTFQRRPSGLAGVVDGVEDFLGSVTDVPAVVASLDGIDAIVHLAAKVSLTGDPAEFDAVNIGGTRILLAAAREAGVARFVFVSSPSVAHSGSSIVGDDALPATPEAARGDYARTKAEAELVALAADSDDLRVVVVRPHLVWGPGDTQLVERIVDRARSHRLPLLGHGAALIDSIYVDNASSGIAAALERVDAVHGNSYVLTNGEPRPVAELIAGMCTAAGVPTPNWRVPAVLARAAGSLVEVFWRIKPGVDEPPMTRFLAEQLSTAHWFDQRRTREDLQWVPAVSLDEGFRRLAVSYGTVADADAATTST